MIFDPVNLIPKKLSDTLKLAIDSDISIYAMHTNYDKAEGGVNDVLAELLGLNNIVQLSTGRIGKIEPMNAPEFASFIAKMLDTHVQYTGDREIRKVMVIGGEAGSAGNTSTSPSNTAPMRLYRESCATMRCSMRGNFAFSTQPTMQPKLLP